MKKTLKFLKKCRGIEIIVVLLIGNDFYIHIECLPNTLITPHMVKYHLWLIDCI